MYTWQVPIRLFFQSSPEVSISQAISLARLAFSIADPDISPTLSEILADFI